MSTPILSTKLYIPPTRPQVVIRARLTERLNDGLKRTQSVTLISAPAGFGKTTLVSEWAADGKRPAAWLSLDEGDNDPIRFLTYIVASLQTIATNIGAGASAALQMLQPPPIESILTTLLNEITTLPDQFILILDDYHVIDAKPVEAAVTFLLEHLPLQMHLVITTREDPHLPLARLRARGQLTELRATDLRFTAAEAAEFLNPVMGLNLSAADIAALENRTEGWIAGLQLAALSMQGQKDVTGFIQSFTGSHHFVMDYLVEEVLHQQSESVQAFLLCTSILDRLCGPLCDAVLLNPFASGQATLEYIERANLFIIPLDNERRWYRYHHLFADLLRQHLLSGVASPAGAGEAGKTIDELHQRASQWYEDNGLEIEAFHHAVAARDVERAARLVEGEGMPLTYRGASTPVLNWLESLPKTTLDARPTLWVTYASALLFSGQQSAVEQKLQAAETALQAQRNAGPDDTTRDLIGRIASMRATLAVIQHDVETIITQSRLALEYLHPDNLPIRTATTWMLGYTYQLQGDRTAASQAYTEVISISKSFGGSIYTLAATLNLGQIQEADNQLYLADESYHHSVQLAGNPPQLMACEAYLGLARITYQWNDLEAAQQHGQQCLQLMRQMESVDTFASYKMFLARLKLAQRDAAGAAAVLAEAETFVRQHNFVHQMPEIVAIQVLALLKQGNLATAAALAETHPISLARVHLAQGSAGAALMALEPLRQQAEAKGWADERLKVMVLQAVAHQAHGEKNKSLQVLSEVLALAKPSGFVRIFVDEGLPMAQLLSEATAQGVMPDYTSKLLAAFEVEQQRSGGDSPQFSPGSSQLLIEPLSERELEILQLIAQGLSNREISERLFLALDTVKGHNRRLYEKLQVQRRTEAVAKARSLHILPRNN